MAEREKSATESIFLSLALISKMQQEQGVVNFAKYLQKIYASCKVTTPIDFRYDNKLFVPGTTEEAALEEKRGNERKNRIFGAYLVLAIAKMRNRVSIEEIRIILKDIFNQEYKARKQQGILAPVLLERFNQVSFEQLNDVWFTGDGVMFVFDNKGEESFILFRPSGTEPKLKSYGFGQNKNRLTINAWVFGFNENTAGQLPESFTKNPFLMKLWGEDGSKAVEKARRMQGAWEDFGLVIDPEDPYDLEKIGGIEKLEKRRLLKTFSPPDNHIELVNKWLREQGLPETGIDSQINVEVHPAMPQSAILDLLKAIPEKVYQQLGRTKIDVLSKEGLHQKKDTSIERCISNNKHIRISV